MSMKLTFGTPFKILGKLYRLVKCEVNEIINPISERYINLFQSYKLAGFKESRTESIERLNGCLISLGLNKYDEDKNMYSEHLIIFSALSALKKKPKNILEIGTYDGTSASILAKLFPESIITTIDLRDNDPIFKSSYERKKIANKFIKERNERINQHENIKFIQINSLELTFLEGVTSQDLIWVDGAHGYPVVTSDITNCLRLLNKDGILMCDDVWKKIRRSDAIYSSIATYETLISFENAKLIKTTFFRKRLGKKYNGNYKFISFSKLNESHSNQIV